MLGKLTAKTCNGEWHPVFQKRNKATCSICTLYSSQTPPSTSGQRLTILPACPAFGRHRPHAERPAFFLIASDGQGSKMYV